MSTIVCTYVQKNHAFSFVVIIFHCVKISVGIKWLIMAACKLVEGAGFGHNEYVELLADRMMRFVSIAVR